MIGYCCKYTPVELLKALGGEPLFLDREEADFEVAEGLTHSNVCCHAKSVIQQGLGMDELLLTDCCDSIRRVYDVLQADGKIKFMHLMELPHEDGQCSRERLRESLISLIESYGKYTGKDLNREVFLEACREPEEPFPRGPWIAVLGARIPPTVLSAIEHQMPLPVVNLTCSGNRNMGDPPENAEQMSLGNLMDWYAGELLKMPPCMRMEDLSGRRGLTEAPGLKGIIYNTVKFCDYYGFEYANLKNNCHVPILKIESDYMPQPAGQLSTRLEAFRETLGVDSIEIKTLPRQEKQGLFVGIDSGSTTTNIAVIDENRQILASAIVRTGAKAQNGAKTALDTVCRQLAITPDKLTAVMATGYGRRNIAFATDTKTEITCHARGAYFLDPSVRTIIDIGGQDSKVICMDPSGAVTNFIMNDKCAAGTGRFLEMMARTLEMDLEEMSRRGTEWKKDLTISSMCTVFAESEVISLIADNHSENDIIHGLNKSIAAKTVSMVKRSKGAAPYMMTGGVARNKGVVLELERRLGSKLHIPPEPDLCGAIGAALFALEEF